MHPLRIPLACSILLCATGCPDKSDLSVNGPTPNIDGLEFVQNTVSECVGMPFTVDLGMTDAGYAFAIEAIQELTKDNRTPTSDQLFDGLTWAVDDTDLLSGGFAGERTDPDPGREGILAETRTYTCTKAGSSTVRATMTYAFPSMSNAIMAAAVPVTCMDCSPGSDAGTDASMSTATGGADPVDDCKEDSAGYKACPANLQHIDITNVQAERDADGVTVTMTTAAPIPMAPLGRGDMKLTLEDMDGFFLASMNMRSRGDMAPYLPPTGDGFTLGDDDSVEITPEGTIRYRLSNAAMEMMEREAGIRRYYVEIGDDNPEGANPFFDKTDYFAFPLKL